MTPGYSARVDFVQGNSLTGTVLFVYKTFSFGTSFYFQNPDLNVYGDSQIVSAKGILRDHLFPPFFFAKITKAQRGLMSSPESHSLFVCGGGGRQW